MRRLRCKKFMRVARYLLGFGGRLVDFDFGARTYGLGNFRAFPLAVAAPPLSSVGRPVCPLFLIPLRRGSFAPTAGTAIYSCERSNFGDSPALETMCTGSEKMVCVTYLRSTQGGPSRIVKEQQEGTSPNHVRAVFSASVNQAWNSENG